MNPRPVWRIDLAGGPGDSIEVSAWTPSEACTIAAGLTLGCSKYVPAEPKLRLAGLRPGHPSYQATEAARERWGSGDVAP